MVLSRWPTRPLQQGRLKQLYPHEEPRGEFVLTGSIVASSGKLPADDSLTANKTAKLTDVGGPVQPMVESEGARSNFSGLAWTPLYGHPAVFKTVCGALLRRPGWVRFPSIPAKFRRPDSQDDSHASGQY